MISYSEHPQFCCSPLPDSGASFCLHVAVCPNEGRDSEESQGVLTRFAFPGAQTNNWDLGATRQGSIHLILHFLVPEAKHNS